MTTTEVLHTDPRCVRATATQQLMIPPVPAGEEQPNIIVGCVLNEPVEIDVIRRAGITLVERHAALRARVNRPAGTSWLQVGSVYDPLVETVGPCGALDTTDLIEEARSWFYRPLDLVAGHPFRLVLMLNRTTGRQVLLFVAHHATCDGWALYLLTRECERLIRGIGLPAKSNGIDFLTMAERVSSLVADEASWSDTAAFWHRHVACPTGDLRPLEALGDAGDRGRLVSIQTELDGDEAERLVSTCKHYGLDPLTAIVCAGAAAIRELAARDGVAVAVPFAARNDPISHRVICTMSNLLTVHVGSSRDDLFRIDETLREARDHLHIPAVSICDRLEREMGRPLSRPEVVVNYLTMGGYGDLHANRCLEADPLLHLGSLPPWANFALEAISHRSGTWQLVCVHRRSNDRSSQVAERLLRSFATALAGQSHFTSLQEVVQ